MWRMHVGGMYNAASGIAVACIKHREWVVVFGSS
jgi:hypothetical protein